MKPDEVRVANSGGLLPCPHCGEQEHLYLAYRLDARGKPDRAPYCIDCIGCGHDFVPREGTDVVAAWNRRADPISAEVLRLRELLTEALPYLDNLGTPDVATVIRAALNGDAP